MPRAFTGGRTRPRMRVEPAATDVLDRAAGVAYAATAAYVEGTRVETLGPRGLPRLTPDLSGRAW